MNTGIVVFAKPSLQNRLSDADASETVTGKPPPTPPKGRAVVSVLSQYLVST